MTFSQMRLPWMYDQGKRIRNALAYVRFTMYDVRFINSIRVAQISRIINVC